MKCQENPKEQKKTAENSETKKSWEEKRLKMNGQKNPGGKQHGGKS